MKEPGMQISGLFFFYFKLIGEPRVDDSKIIENRCNRP